MNKKLSSLICIALIVIISIPVVSIAFAGKPDKGPIEKRVFIHRVKPDKPGKPPKPGKEWYKYSGIHWASTDLPVTYVVDYELDLGVIETSFETWDDETATELFFVGVQREVTAGFLDDTNALSYGNYPTSGVIAVTYIWYYGYTGEIVEVDTLFDTDYTWGDATFDPTVMDLQNIATHEFGHWLLLHDLYNRPARTQTMYGYSTYGETIKRTLESGDIAGIQEIYGE
ncbi:matrixin family metalloprotease [Candidatus Bathyarchaeota archaeon]|nr:matrixin family metalloprotease [Candidatus Bathyarchaeota archaeon]